MNDGDNIIHVFVDSRLKDFPEFYANPANLQVRRFPSSRMPVPKDHERVVWFFHARSYLELLSKKRSVQLEPKSVILIDPEESYAGNEDGILFRRLPKVPCPEAIGELIRSVDQMRMLRALMAKNELALKRKEQINRELLSIAIALSAERDNRKLLNLILEKCREITHSDAGSLYLIERDAEGVEQTLLFKIAHNDSNPTDFTEFRMPLNRSSIAGYVAVTGEILNIPDAYTIPPESGLVFNKSYDEATGYRSKSMLTLPMMNHQGKAIGVIQLINKKKDYHLILTGPEVTEEEVVPYDQENEEIILALSSLAAVSLENNLLYNEIETLFEGFVQASVKAIESRDPTTSGHSSRVALYTVGLARAVSRRKTGRFKDVVFSEDNIKEIRYASLLHDFGKVGVREHVLVKAKKLYPDQIESLKSRFTYIRKCIQEEYQKKGLTLLLEQGPEAYRKALPELERKEKKELDRIIGYLKTVLLANEPRLLEEKPAHVLEEIASRTYRDMEGEERPYLTIHEMNLLSIRRGSLNEEERKEIESHVIHSYEFLKNIPWTSTMKDIPAISRSHHEVLTGHGYPDGLSGDQIPFPSKMMIIADLFDALTAGDRPYKKALTKEEALGILRKEAEDGRIDRDLVDIFIEDGVYALEDKTED
ncbi:MAG: GAF domain-containing protein [Spirochaetales bacterium]|nr:GAF domain-containing protein [Spirochaetales bacterium]